MYVCKYKKSPFDLLATTRHNHTYLVFFYFHYSHLLTKNVYKIINVVRPTFNSLGFGFKSSRSRVFFLWDIYEYFHFK